MGLKSAWKDGQPDGAERSDRFQVDDMVVDGSRACWIGGFQAMGGLKMAGFCLEDYFGVIGPGPAPE